MPSHPAHYHRPIAAGWQRWLLLTLLPLLLFALPAEAARIKDLAALAGVRSNQLLGYGLVVGLDGSGDQVTQTEFTVQSLRSMLDRLGVTLPPGASLQSKNIAAVMVSGDLPPFAKVGQNIDVTVSSIGNAKSLRGGTLLMTPMKGADGQIYAIAQGNLVVSGFGAEAQDGSRITVNVPSVGRIPNGASVERTVATGFGQGNYLTLNLHEPDFTTANRIAEAINHYIGPDSAQPLDASSVRVTAPRDPSQRVSYVSMLENLTVQPGSAAAKVIVNSRTGTVVIGQHVQIQPAAVTHGNLTVTIRSDLEVNQPNPFGGGEAVVVPQNDIQITQERNRMFLFEPGVSLNELVNAVNDVGAAPGDLVAILEALKQAGALQAELIVI